MRGLRQGISEFHNAFGEVTGLFDESAGDAGRSLAGIHGKPAAEALTIENQTVEIYDATLWQGRGSADHAAKKAHRVWLLISSLLSNRSVRYTLAGIGCLVLLMATLFFFR
jgi:hypothetical protein